MTDFYDTEFEVCLRKSKELILKLTNKQGEEDRLICAKWVAKLFRLKTNDVIGKKNRNEFFKYLLQIIESSFNDSCYSDGSTGSPLYSGEQDCSQFVPIEDNNQKCMFRQSEDGRTYVAIKPLPNNGALIYMAVTDNSDLGWDIPGSSK